MQKEKEKEKTAFTEDDRQVLIEYFKQHSMLWNHHIKEYRNRELRRMKLESLADILERRYSVDKIQNEWHNLTTHFERERMRMEGSRKSGAGSDEVYHTKWPYYGLMEFCLDKSLPDKAVSTMTHSSPVPKKVSKKENLEEKKAKLFEVIADRLSKDSPTDNNGHWQQAWQQGFQAGFQQAWQQCSQMFMQQQMKMGTPPVTTGPNLAASNQPPFQQPIYPGNPTNHWPYNPMGNMSNPSGYTSSPLRSIQPEPPVRHFQQSPSQPETPHKRRCTSNTTHMCIQCGRTTKYMCVSCQNRVCNICSTPADPLSTQNYCEEGEIKRVGYCQDCC